MTGFPRGKAAVVGAAVHGIGKNPGSTAMELLAQASLKAIADAGLEVSDIDGVIGTLSQDPLSVITVAEYLGIRPKVMESTITGGSAFQIQAAWAALALDAGLCDNVLICYASNQASIGGGLQRTPAAPFYYEAVYKPRNPANAYALATARYMHQFGATREDFAEVALAANRF